MSRYARNRKELAARTLSHYLRSIGERAGLRFDSDLESEVESIVEAIVDAAVAEAAEHIEEPSR